LAFALVCGGLAGAAPAEAPLAWRFKDKDRFWVEAKGHRVSKTRQNGQSSESAGTCADLCRVTVLEARPEGGAVLELTVERVEQTVTGMQRDLLTQMLQGASVRVTLAADGKVTALEGLGPLVTMVAGKEEGPARQQVQATVEQRLRSLLGNIFYPLPNKAVREGDTWQARDEGPVFGGRHVQTKTFTARGNTTAAGRPVRKIGIRAASQFVPADQPGPVQDTRVEFRHADHRGTLLYDPQAGRLLRGWFTGRVKVAVSSQVFGKPVEGEEEVLDERTLRTYDRDPRAGAEAKAWRPDGPAPKKLTNSLGMKLVLVPASKFNMGSATTEQGRSQDEDQHEVEITRPFYIGAYEVTIGQFRQFVEATGHKTTAETNTVGGFGFDQATGKVGPSKDYSWRRTGWEVTDEHPVTNVSWDDARAFCAWLTKKEGRPYRLPTEAEWEYACRAGTTTRYHHGDDPEGLVQTGNVADVSTHKLFPQWTTIKGEDGALFTAPVGKYRPNAWGLYDMHGNVTEWCEDWYWRYNPDARRDPAGPPAGLKRVMRGGSWADFPLQCGSAHRGWLEQERYTPGTGLRVVLPVDCPDSVRARR
jgi:formylglycine-generating enzyme required for sulfatase activity